MKKRYLFLLGKYPGLTSGWLMQLSMGKKKSNNNPPSVSSLDPYCSHGNSSHVTLMRAGLSAGLYLMECSERACE